MKNIDNLFKKQKKYFKNNKTQDISFRLNKLKLLKQTLKENETKIYSVLKKDLSKPPFESFTTELGMILREIDSFIKNSKKWVKPEKFKTSWLHFKTSSYVYKVPYGVVLIIAPWNYPLQLGLIPLVGAIAGGNCVILKPSENAPHTAKFISEIIKQTFEEDYVAVIQGEVGTAQELLDKDFDYIFFTGSPEIGKIVMKKAASHLTPVTLELGGKSPCIIDEDVNLELAVRRSMWGKLLNAGQTCVAPDYLLIPAKYKRYFIQKAKETVIKFYGNDIKNNPDYPRIINNKHFQRLITMLNNSQGKIVAGGDYSKKDLFFSPTLVTEVKVDDSLMSEEIFGPILPVLEFTDFAEIFSIIERQPSPLALYLFSNNKERQKKVISKISFGGGCINDTIIHTSSKYLPFGGVGSSALSPYLFNYFYR